MGHAKTILTNTTGIESPTPLLPQSSDKLDERPHKWYYYLWDTLDKPVEERWFMFKLDAALLTFASLGKTQLIDDRLLRTC